MIRNAEVVQRVQYRTPSLTLIINQGGVVVHILVLICNNVRLHDIYNIKLQFGTRMSRNECTKAQNKSCKANSYSSSIKFSYALVWNLQIYENIHLVRGLPCYICVCTKVENNSINPKFNCYGTTLVPVSFFIIFLNIGNSSDMQDNINISFGQRFSAFKILQVWHKSLLVYNS
jgi:hypothetical protein